MKSELHVPSDLNFLIVVENWLMGCLEIQLQEFADWSGQSNRLRLALVEAYSNVVRHAHKDKPYLPVVICLEIKEREISLEVWDQGKGYDFNTYLAPSPLEKQEGGYGWLIINRLMDKVEYHLQVNGCNCLKLETTMSKDC
ncbi:MAG: anti-sigma regulatory factor [Stigonema ocellatum SAG 48.90 = DSM 106950]|nr:anti-sigma regulatory factor [Stigonema ocellatum SAG 48.90 = DSM 106950]